MLFVFIDIFERLVAWLKSFTGRQTSALFSGAAVDWLAEGKRPSPDEVRAKFTDLKKNAPGTVKGIIATASTEQLIVGKIGHPETADASVWNEMSNFCGTAYHVVTFS